MKGKASSTELLDKTIWNLRPVIDLPTRAIRESGGSFLLVLGPTFSALLTVSALLTGAVGIAVSEVKLPVSEVKPPPESRSGQKSPLEVQKSCG